MSTEITIRDPDASQLTRDSSAIVAESKSFAIIKDDDHCQQAIAFGQRVKGMRDMVGQLYDAEIKQAHSLHKSLCAKRNALNDPLESAETTIKRGVGNYEAAKRAAIEEARRKEEAAAREAAQLAEIERQKAIDDARKLAEDARLKQAEELEAQGRHDLAARVVAAPVMIQAPPPVQVAPPVATTPKYEAPTGTSLRRTWKFRIVDVSLIPREYLIANEMMLGMVARTHKENASVPGVEFYAEASASLR